MNDPQAAHEVGNALSRMMPASIPTLTNVLANGNARARSSAASALITAGSHRAFEPAARTALLAALHDPDSGVRMSAASAFQFWNGHLDIVVPALAEALKDPAPNVRGNAVTALGRLGHSAKAAAPDVVRLLADTNSYGYPDGSLSNRAAAMLLMIDPDAAKAAGIRQASH